MPTNENTLIMYVYIMLCNTDVLYPARLYILRKVVPRVLWNSCACKNRVNVDPEGLICVLDLFGFVLFLNVTRILDVLI